MLQLEIWFMSKLKNMLSYLSYSERGKRKHIKMSMDNGWIFIGAKLQNCDTGNATPVSIS